MCLGPHWKEPTKEEILDGCIQELEIFNKLLVNLYKSDETESFKENLYKVYRDLDIPYKILKTLERIKNDSSRY